MKKIFFTFVLVFIFLNSCCVGTKTIDCRLLNYKTIDDRTQYRLKTTNRRYTGNVVDSTSFPNFIYRYTLKKGYINGLFQVFWHNKLDSESYYMSGQLQRRKVYFSNGNLRSEAIVLKNGIEFKRFRKNGDLILHAIYDIEGEIVESFIDIRTPQEKIPPFVFS